MKKIAIWMGYSEGFNGLNYKSKKLYGSELSCLKLCEILSDTYDITIYSSIPEEDEIKHNNIKYKQLLKIKNEISNYDIVIVYRYINFFLYCSCPKKVKVILWLSDLAINYYYNGIQLHDYAKHLLNNVKHKIDNIICLSKFHKLNIENIYHNCLKDKNVNFIYYPIEYKKNDNEEELKIIKNRFIYMSSLDRGFTVLLDYLIELQKFVSDISLVFFRNEKLTDELKLKLVNIKNVISFGTVDNFKVVEECKKAEYFLYPTTFLETFCCCAAEAQLYKTVCIYNRVGSLNDVIDDRGLILSNNFQENINSILNLMSNNKLKQKYIEKGYNWAKNLAESDYVKNEWIKVLEE